MSANEIDRIDGVELNKEILEEAITNDTIVLESNEVQALIDADCTLEKFFETNKKNTFWFL